jgi:hypothetical protein
VLYYQLRQCKLSIAKNVLANHEQRGCKLSYDLYLMEKPSMEVREFFRQMGKKGGSKGGKTAAKNMTKAQRSARARKAAAASAKVRTKKARERRNAAKGK